MRGKDEQQRSLGAMTDEAFTAAATSAQQRYAKIGRSSIAPEKLDDSVWDKTVFTKNRERLLDGDIAEAFFQAVLHTARERNLRMAEDDRAVAESSASRNPQGGMELHLCCSRLRPGLHAESGDSSGVSQDRRVRRVEKDLLSTGRCGQSSSVNHELSNLEEDLSRIIQFFPQPRIVPTT
jgi:hypothetical protein